MSNFDTPSTSRTVVKHSIPHPNVPGCFIAGLLERSGQVDDPTAGRDIALILHGALGHKDYLFQKKVASRLPMDSFRFDFRGNHETPGSWQFAAFAEEVLDLQAVVEYLSAPPFSYVVRLIVGHSRGSLVAYKWLASGAKHVESVQGFVSISCRYRMERIRGRLDVYRKEWESQGFYAWRAKVVGREVVGKIYPSDVEKFASWDTSFVWTQFPKHIDVLTIHGLADVDIPPYEAILYARALSQRSPGTHVLHLIEKADHNFIGHFDEVAETAVEWWKARGKRSLKSGIWCPTHISKL